MEETIKQQVNNNITAALKRTAVKTTSICKMISLIKGVKPKQLFPIPSMLNTSNIVFSLYFESVLAQCESLFADNLRAKPTNHIFKGRNHSLQIFYLVILWTISHEDCARPLASFNNYFKQNVGLILSFKPKHLRWLVQSKYKSGSDFFPQRLPHEPFNLIQ